MRATAILLLLAVAAPAARLKDLVDVEGVRDNQLVGYGIVVGLAGKGDSQQTVFPYQSLTNMLERMGVAVSPTAIRVKNTAAVMVTATLLPFAQPGTRLDVTISSIGDAATLQGGILIMTSLRGADSQVYAVAQGPVVTGAFLAGRGGATQAVNHPTVGRAPNGAIVERAAPSVTPKTVARLQLREPDATTASRIAEAINKRFTNAHADNSGLVSVPIPKDYLTRSTDFLAELESLTVEPDRAAKVIINERTGTIVLGKDVRISPVAIMHGNLNVEVQRITEVSQPNPLSQGTTQVVQQDSVKVSEEKSRNVMLKDGATIEELVRALAAIGSTPRDIIAILQSLKSAGALEAEIEVI
ncbi:MAG TPA: flagellar basal body P-ring protein FlgI [Bryobacteraceae bacterium]|jgi:flagellar P-ring protein precursor FlgI|nr:flagellar basal body P-ring protein FlgI [Bryobacteraceae bacterium]